MLERAQKSFQNIKRESVLVAQQLDEEAKYRLAYGSTFATIAALPDTPSGGGSFLALFSAYHLIRGGLEARRVLRDRRDLHRFNVPITPETTKKVKAETDKWVDSNITESTYGDGLRKGDAAVDVYVSKEPSDNSNSVVLSDGFEPQVRQGYSFINEETENASMLVGTMHLEPPTLRPATELDGRRLLKSMHSARRYHERRKATAERIIKIITTITRTN